MKITHVFLFLIFTLFACSSAHRSANPITPIKAKTESDYNRGYSAALKAGENLGYKKGFDVGRKKGKEEGLYAGKLIGKDSLLKDMKKIDYDKYAITIINNYDLYRENIDNFESAYRKGWIIGYEEKNSGGLSVGL